MVTLYLVAAALTLAATGCVDGSPVEPELCTIYSDSLAFGVDMNVLYNCPSGRIRVSVRVP